MSRPCTCNRQRPGPYTLDQCRLCWLYHHEPAYRALWDAGPSAPCRHLGPATGATSACPSCRGTVALKLFACARHGHCTLTRSVPEVPCCATCPDHELVGA